MSLLIAGNLYLAVLIISLLILLSFFFNFLDKMVPEFEVFLWQFALVRGRAVKLEQPHLIVEKSEVDSLVVILVVNLRRFGLRITEHQVNTFFLGYFVENFKYFVVSFVDATV